MIAPFWEPSFFIRKKLKLFLYQAVEAHMVVRRRGSHIYYTVGSQMAVRLSALRAGRPPFTPQEDFWYSFLLEAESIPGGIVRLERLGQLNNPIISSGMEPGTFRFLVYFLDQLLYRVPPSVLITLKNLFVNHYSPIVPVSLIATALSSYLINFYTWLIKISKNEDD
jgi:hypothetical protein